LQGEGFPRYEDFKLYNGEKYVAANSLPNWTGVGVGIIVSLAAGLVYVVLLREPGSAFYGFAGLAFLGGPLIGGIIAARNTQERKRKAFLSAGGMVFAFACGLFVITYVVVPKFDRASIQLPPFCEGLDGSFNPPSHLVYRLPGGESGILLSGDVETAVVAVVDAQQPP
jgi:hypothetical protein